LVDECLFEVDLLVVVEGDVALLGLQQDLVDQLLGLAQSAQHLLVVLHGLLDVRDLHLHLQLSEGDVEVPPVLLLQRVLDGLVGVRQLRLGLVELVQAVPREGVLLGDVDLLDDLLLVRQDGLQEPGPAGGVLYVLALSQQDDHVF
jgi:hypothetical protein